MGKLHYLLLLGDSIIVLASTTALTECGEYEGFYSAWHHCILVYVYVAIVHPLWYFYYLFTIFSLLAVPQ